MEQNAFQQPGPEVSGRVWSFAGCEFNELSRELKVNGVEIEIEPKPIEVLVELLRHAGEVLTKDELLETVWPGVMVVDGSLATAVSKLRKALGDDDSSMVLTVPRVGYRFAVPVHVKATVAASVERPLKTGDFVPGREQWKLARELGAAGLSDVWLCEQTKTHEKRVFKFASNGAQLKGLKREITLSRYLRESLGERADFVRALEWNFDSTPYFVESEYCGPNLQEWAASQGGLASVPHELRLNLIIGVARAVAAAHDVGVLHKDLKPANVLVRDASGGRQVAVADFGSAALMDPAKLRELGITNLGFTRSIAREDESLSGTLMYMAPEVLGGQSPTASADVFALGVMLWQVTVGDFRRPLSPGWEAEISDELIREDIAAAACGDPAKRLNSAAELAERLSTLDSRRVHRNELAQAELRAEVAERELADACARRPWIWFAAAALIAGLAASLFLYREALLERDIAKRQTNITNAINLFLADDLLGRSNPFQSGKAAESLVDAVNQASASIDSQFKNAPEVAARVHHTIAKALDSRTNYADARREYERAATLYLQTEGPLSQNAIEARLQRAFMEARSYEGTALKVAKDLLAQEEALLPQIKNPKPELGVWRLSTQGMISLVENDAKAANQQFKAALDGANSLSSFDENAKLAFEQRLAFTYIRLGDGAKAETLFRELIDSYSRLTGPGSPNVLRVRLNLAQALMIQRKYQESIDEANAIYPAFVAGLGTEHDLTMQLLSTRAESEGSIEMWDAAIRDDMGIYKIASAKQGPASFYAVASLSDAALAQCRSNQLAQGELNARSAYDIARKAFGEKAGITGGTADTLASCLIEMNRLDEADKLLRSIDTSAVAQITGMPDWGANISLADAEIAYRRGDYAKARQLVESAAPVMTRPDAEAYQRRKLQMLQVALSNKAQQNARN